MNNPAVSIIIPVYNAENYLRRCIESVLSQSFTSFELILVDDGSKDRSPQICDEFACKDSRVRVMHKPNGGVSAARNDGLDIATGDYITFIDADDWVEKGYIKCLYDNRKYDYVIGTFVSEPAGRVRESVHQTFEGDRTKDFVTITHLSNGYPWGKLFQSKIIKINSIRFHLIKVYEDLLFCLEYIRHCSSICILSHANYHYFNPNDKVVVEKFKLTKEDVVWLYLCTQKEVDLISEKFGTRPVTLMFNFYLHLNLVDLYERGDDKVLSEAYKMLHPNATADEYYNDTFASPIRVLLDKISQTIVKDIKKCVYMMKLLNTMDCSKSLTTIGYTSKVNKVCAYCIKYELYPLAVIVLIIAKIKAKILLKFRL